MIYNGNYINHIKQIRQMFLAKPTLSVDEINKALTSGPYAIKYVSMMRKHLNFGIDVNKDGRTVQSYTLVKDTDMDLNQWDKPAKAPKAPKVSKAAKAPKPVKSAKPAKAAKTDGKPVMTVEEIKKATAAIVAMREKNVKSDVEKVLTSAPAASSFNVDPDWDKGVEDVRDLLR
jgi:hypothetical protein